MKSTYRVTRSNYKAKMTVWKKPIIAFREIKANKNGSFDKRKEPKVKIYFEYK